jgi:hypothetical protein
MSDPKRMLETTDDEFERALLSSVRRDAMPMRSRRRILTGLGIAGALVTTSSTAVSSAAASNGLFKGLTGVVVKWVAVSAIASLVPAGVWVARTHLRGPDVVATAPAPMAATPSGPRSTSKEPAAVLPIATEIAPAAKPSSPLREPRRETQREPSGPTLSDEVAALQVARTALADHDSGGALAALDRYKSRFPAGRLAPEATVLRIDALLERGDRAQASALADRFESANPKSPYTERIRSILGRAKAPAKDPGAR